MPELTMTNSQKDALIQEFCSARAGHQTCNHPPIPYHRKDRIMKALTIWQPWASLIMIGAKPYEFRSWMPPRSQVGKRMVIHAGSRKMKLDEVVNMIERLNDPARAWSTCLRPDIALPFLTAVRDDLIQGRQSLPLGCGLGTALVGTAKVGGAIAKEFGCEFVNDSDRDDHANWGWPMIEVEAWDDPIPMTGKQGLWNWPTPEGLGL